MTINIRLTGEDKQQIEENHGEAVLERLCGKVETKNETLQWKSSVEECSQRFYTVIKKKGEIFPFIFFKVDEYQYRAVLCWNESDDTFEFVRVVGKNDHYPNSRQRKVCTQIVNHPKEIASQVKEVGV